MANKVAVANKVEVEVEVEVEVDLMHGWGGWVGYLKALSGASMGTLPGMFADVFTACSAFQACTQPVTLEKPCQHSLECKRLHGTARHAKASKFPSRA